LLPLACCITLSAALTCACTVATPATAKQHIENFTNLFITNLIFINFVFFGCKGKGFLVDNQYLKMMKLTFFSSFVGI
jgi:hypothetical protein